MGESIGRFNLIDLVLISLTSSLGAGIFVLSGEAMETSGQSSLVSLALTLVLALIGCTCFYELARFVSKEGSVFEYVRETFSPNVGFISGVLWVGALLSCAAAASINLAYYAGILLAQHTTGPTTSVVAALISCLAAVVVLSGFKLSPKMLMGYVAMCVAALAIFVVWGLRFISLDVQVGVPALPGIAFASAGMFFAFAGFSKITIVARKVAGGGKTIRTAMYASVLLLFVLYIPLALMATGISSVSNFTGRGGGLGVGSLPLMEALLLHNRYITLLFVAISAVVTVGLALVCIAGAAEVFHAMGRDNELPAIFGARDTRQMPRAGVLLSVAVIIAMIFSARASTIIDTISACMLIAVIIVELAALNLSIKERGDRRARGALIGSRYFAALPVAGIAGDAAVLLSVGHAGLELAVVVLVVAGAYYTYGKVLVLPKGRATVVRSSPENVDVSEFVK